MEKVKTISTDCAKTKKICTASNNTRVSGLHLHKLILFWKDVNCIGLFRGIFKSDVLSKELSPK